MDDHYNLLFDVGNTTINVGISRGGDGGDMESYSLPTKAEATADALGLSLSQLVVHAGLAPDQADAFVLCSVAPAVDPLIRKAGQRFFGCPLFQVPGDIDIPLENLYERPGEVGADRLVTAYAARQRLSAEHLIVVDFGTATTFDCVRGNAYLGGLICPGVLSSTRALATQTAKLPQISLDVADEELERPTIGRSTSQSLNQGLVHGFGAMVDGLVDRLAASMGVQSGMVTVMGTGGLASTISRASKRMDRVDPGLLLKGLEDLLRDSQS